MSHLISLHWAGKGKSHEYIELFYFIIFQTEMGSRFQFSLSSGSESESEDADTCWELGPARRQAGNRNVLDFGGCMFQGSHSGT